MRSPRATTRASWSSPTARDASPRGADGAKDQSYVVHVVSLDALARVRFPVGHLTKHDVRAEAARLGLLTADKPDSQDVCFITATGGRSTFLGDRIETRRGRGRRRATGPSSAPFPPSSSSPSGSAGVSDSPGAPTRATWSTSTLPTATVTVGSEADLLVDRVTLTDLAWVGPAEAGPLTAQVSAHSPPRPCRVDGDAVVFRSPARRVAPGQSVVLYDGDLVVGGGIAAG